MKPSDQHTGEQPGTSPSEGEGGTPSPRRSRRGRTPSNAAPDHAPHRVVAALKLLAEGERYTEVRSALQSKFQISRATAERDLARAYSEIALAADAERPTLAARISDRIWRLGLRAERRRDDHLALAAYQALAKLIGVGGERVVVESPMSMADRALLDALRFTPAQRQNQMRGYTEQLRAAGVDVDAVQRRHNREGDEHEDKEGEVRAARGEGKGD